MIWTGYISYSLYMSHAIVEKVLKVALNPAKYAAASVPVKSGILMLNVGVLLFSAMAVYYFVEIPCRRWLRALRVGDSGKVK